MVTIGVLALQGDVAEHVRALENSGARALLVRRVSELDQVDGLVIPGGESTTMSNLLLPSDCLMSCTTALPQACRSTARARA